MRMFLSKLIVVFIFLSQISIGVISGILAQEATPTPDICMIYYCAPPSTVFTKVPTITDTPLPTSTRYTLPVYPGPDVVKSTPVILITDHKYYLPMQIKGLTNNLWDTTDKVILVTGNAYVTKEGRLVMGKGAALEMKERYPNIDYTFGHTLEYYDLVMKKYGVIKRTTLKDDTTIDYIRGVFQVKYDFKDKADLDLIKYSVEYLNRIVDTFGNSLYGMKVSMNFPGIKNGRLTEEEVLPIIEQLSDLVTIYKREE